MRRLGPSRAAVLRRERLLKGSSLEEVHDEFQVEAPEDYAMVVGQAFRDAIRKAGESLALRCPLDGEYQIGTNWSETH